LAMLQNSRLIRGANQRIGRQRINAERAIQIEIEEIAKAFAAMPDPYLAARIDDIRVVGARLIRNLLKRPYIAYSGLSGGAVILDPSPETVAEYREKQEKFARERRQYGRLRRLPAVTKDGIEIRLEANLELPVELDQAVAHGAMGLGLVRTEFLYMNREELP